MQNELQKVINLAKKTGDRVIFFDSHNPSNTFVIMNLDDYEKIVLGKSELEGLTEEELLDKINRDIAIWKSSNNSEWAEVRDVLDKKSFIKNKPNFINKCKDDDFCNIWRKEESLVDLEEETNEYNEDDDIYYYENENKEARRESLPDVNFWKGEKRKNNWNIPNKIKEQAEEVATDIPF